MKELFENPFSRPAALYYIYLLCMGLVLFFMMASDKSRARKGSRRISEKRLFAFALLGGALGGSIGMHVFRHKTRHWYFRLFFPLLALLQLALPLLLQLLLR